MSLAKITPGVKSLRQIRGQASAKHSARLKPRPGGSIRTASLPLSSRVAHSLAETRECTMARLFLGSISNTWAMLATVKSSPSYCPMSKTLVAGEPTSTTKVGVATVTESGSTFGPQFRMASGS